MADAVVAPIQSTRFLLLYALAWGGGAIAFVPFLTILLPMRVMRLAPEGMAISWLAYIAFAGAVAASISNIGFGYLSDLTRNRRAWIGAGMTLSCGMLFAVSRANDLAGLIVTVGCWQLALNMMLAPLAAWAGDCIPNSQKGLLGGLLAFGPGLGAVSCALVTIPGMALPNTRLALVALLVACCVVPVLTMGAPTPVAEPETPVTHAQNETNRVPGRTVVLRMWTARLAVQIAEAALFAYLYLWFRSIDPAMSDNRTARIFSTVLILSAPIALLVGRRADRVAQPIAPLVACAAISAVALVGMALARTLPVAIGMNALFGLAASVFLALHSAQTLRVLPRPDRRGRDLGLFNLTNTVPSMIMPWLTLALVPYFGFSALFLLFAMLAFFAALVLWPLKRQKY